MKTIRRNEYRQIRAIADAAMHARHSRPGGDTYEHPQLVTVEIAFSQLFAFNCAKLRDNEDGTYTISLDKYRWYTLYTAEYFQALGRAAYAKPNAIAAPAADGELTKLMEGMPVGTGAKEMMLAWQAGWTAAADEAAAAILAEGV